MLELSGSVTDKEKGFIETWENVGASTNWYIREDRRGDEAHVEAPKGKQFKLSTWDRMLTEDKIYDHRLNPFKNGAFRPVIVPQDVTIESNPNAMSHEDIIKLFAASDVAWQEYMDVIDSPSTLQRMVDLAETGDYEISVRRLKQLTSMLDRFNNINKRAIKQKDQEQYEAMGTSGSNSEPVPNPRARRVIVK